MIRKGVKCFGFSLRERGRSTNALVLSFSRELTKSMVVVSIIHVYLWLYSCEMLPVYIESTGKVDVAYRVEKTINTYYGSGSE